MCAALLAAVACQRAAPSPHAAPHVRLTVPEEDPSAATVEVVGLPAGDLTALRKQLPADAAWPSIFRVTVVPDDLSLSGDGLPPIAGRYEVTASSLAFKPMYGFDAGRRYLVTFDPTRLPARDDAPWRRQPMTEAFSRPRPAAAPSTYVDHVYPSVDVVPENQLRLYLHFSAPMGLKGGLDYVRLFDSGGREVTHAFLPLDAGFWNDDRTRYTVFFDPGRVKRGILPNEQLGRPLKRGARYTLVVSREWTDAQGLPLREEHRRTFQVGPVDMHPIDPGRWVLQAPASGTREAFAVTFPKPLDRGLLARTLAVVGSGGATLVGHTDIGEGETRWMFTPDRPWTAGDYKLVVLTILEDLAGNRIGRAFEVDQFERTDRSAEPDSISIPFRVK